MAVRIGILLLCALGTSYQFAAATTRQLQQSHGPAETYGNAAAATSADLPNDFAGRAALLVRSLSAHQDSRVHLRSLPGLPRQ